MKKEIPMNVRVNLKWVLNKRWKLWDSGVVRRRKNKTRVFAELQFASFPTRRSSRCEWKKVEEKNYAWICTNLYCHERRFSLCIILRLKHVYKKIVHFVPFFILCVSAKWMRTRSDRSSSAEQRLPSLADFHSIILGFVVKFEWKWEEN